MKTNKKCGKGKAPCENRSSFEHQNNVREVEHGRSNGEKNLNFSVQPRNEMSIHAMENSCISETKEGSDVTFINYVSDAGFLQCLRNHHDYICTTKSDGEPTILHSSFN
jgi:hypothetical protein